MKLCDHILSIYRNEIENGNQPLYISTPKYVDKNATAEIYVIMKHKLQNYSLDGIQEYRYTDYRFPQERYFSVCIYLNNTAHRYAWRKNSFHRPCRYAPSDALTFFPLSIFARHSCNKHHCNIYGSCRSYNIPCRIQGRRACGRCTTSYFHTLPSKNLDSHIPIVHLTYYLFLSCVTIVSVQYLLFFTAR